MARKAGQGEEEEVAQSQEAGRRDASPPGRQDVEVTGGYSIFPISVEICFVTEYVVSFREGSFHKVLRRRYVLCLDEMFYRLLVNQVHFVLRDINDQYLLIPAILL
ncbi:hypothetical protein STEG23_005630, partial [Scotinomys teguina]